MKLRSLIVDDEPMARRRLRRLVEKSEDVVVLGECGDGRAAINSIQQLRPDVVFLDVQMPYMNGFDVLRAIDAEQMPIIIFVTAFDRYAIDAFDAQALDYLLKPFGEDRVQKALKRARAVLERDAKSAFQEQLSGLLREIAPSRNASCILVKGNERVIVLRPQEIDWIEADGDYVRLHAGQETFLHRSTLTEMEQRLDRAGFVRIHRSRLVNLDRIKEFRPLFRGESVVVLKNGARLNASHSCLKALQDQFRR